MAAHGRLAGGRSRWLPWRAARRRSRCADDRRRRQPDAGADLMFMPRLAVLAVVPLFVVAPAGVRPSAAPVCAATPQDAWTLAQQAVATGDAGLVTERLSPDYRARNALEMAI